MPQGAALVSVDRLTKTFRLYALGDALVRGCAGVSFDVGPGHCVRLAGPSGSGKSSVLKCVYRTYRPTSGTIRYRDAAGEMVDLGRADDRRVLALRRREIAYVSQFLRVVPRVPARDVIAEGLWHLGFEVEQGRLAADAVLDRLAIPRALWPASPVTFSGGEQQRVNLARAIVLQPRLLLLDEPTSALSPEAAAVVVEMLRDLKRAGTAMIVAFHDDHAVGDLVDHVVCMTGPAHAGVLGGGS
ncbi:MAG TPA: ATP-binding cassette domain-containing protein [bacterium]|nr:ATP-binding cassette domain-containing protein [bacterium]